MAILLRGTLRKIPSQKRPHAVAACHGQWRRKSTATTTTSAGQGQGLASNSASRKSGSWTHPHPPMASVSADAPVQCVPEHNPQVQMASVAISFGYHERANCCSSIWKLYRR